MRGTMRKIFTLVRTRQKTVLKSTSTVKHWRSFIPFYFRYEPKMLNLTESITTKYPPRLNIVVPSITTSTVFGGILTALVLGCLIKKKAPSIKIRFITVIGPVHREAAVSAIESQIINAHEIISDIEFLDGSEVGAQFISLHSQEHFMATAWHTCFFIRKLSPHKPFFYLIQDYEPNFFPNSEDSAMADATYAMDYIPIVNSRFLFEYLTTDTGTIPKKTAVKGTYFEPAIPPEIYSIADSRQQNKSTSNTNRTLFFYARPSKPRNLFRTGVLALEEATKQNIITESWQLFSAGEQHSDIVFSNGAILKSLGKLSLSDYYRLLSKVDVGLSLMMSSHPSYPPLEVAASGAYCVTTNYGSKRIEELSPLLIGTGLSPKEVTAGLKRAIESIEIPKLVPVPPTKLALPSSWEESLDRSASLVINIIRNENQETSQSY